MARMQNSQNLAGYKWIAQTTGVAPVSPFRVTSEITAQKTHAFDDGRVRQTFPKTYEPRPDVCAHLTFAAKYEGIDLDYLARLFANIGYTPFQQWIQREPTSAYARQFGFLYEWLTKTAIPDIGEPGGNYVDVIDSSRYFSATKPDKDKRWRVNNNLPGTQDFCPMIAIDSESGLGKHALRHDHLQQRIQEMVKEFGQATIERAVNWLTVKESRASFEIEREGKEENRIKRLASAMVHYCGQIDSALSEAGMTTIQDAIMGEATTGFNLGQRQSPVFVGHNNPTGAPVIDYLAPPHTMVASLMEGLRAFEARTRGQNPLIRAAAISFGFVYIHPLHDGNGRLSRFLINDILRRDGFITPPLILPVSAVITESAGHRHGYDKALERLSRPLMARLNPLCSFGAKVTHDDGVTSNIYCQDWRQGEPSWRYMDLTWQTSYMSQVIAQSITEGLAQEAIFLQRHDRSVHALKHLIEASDADYGAIIRSITSTNGISGKLRKTYPKVFEDEDLAAKILNAVLQSFELISPAEEDITPILSVRPRSS